MSWYWQASVWITEREMQEVQVQMFVCGEWVERRVVKGRMLMSAWYDRVLISDWKSRSKAGQTGELGKAGDLFGGCGSGRVLSLMVLFYYGRRCTRALGSCCTRYVPA